MLFEESRGRCLHPRVNALDRSQDLWAGSVVWTLRDCMPALHNGWRCAALPGQATDAQMRRGRAGAELRHKAPTGTWHRAEAELRRRCHFSVLPRPFPAPTQATSAPAHCWTASRIAIYLTAGIQRSQAGVDWIIGFNRARRSEDSTRNSGSQGGLGPATPSAQRTGSLPRSSTRRPACSGTDLARNET